MPSFTEHVLDVYGVSLYLARDGRQWAAIRKSRMPRLDKMPEAVGFTEMHASGGSVDFAILIPRGLGDLERLNTCAHEATHIATQTLDMVHAEYDGRSEPLAYLVGWLTTWLWEHTAD